MLKLVLGALIGGANYEDVYKESEFENENENNLTEDEHQSTSMNKIPTMAGTARKVAKLEKRKLDENSYIAYEMIASTFLLGLVRDGNDPTTTLYSGLTQTMRGNDSMTIKMSVMASRQR